MRNSFLRARPSTIPMLWAVILLTACRGPKTVPETPEVVRETEVTPAAVTEQRATQPAATSTPYPTYTPYPSFTPPPSATATRTPTLTAIPAATQTATLTSTPTEAPTPVPAQPVLENTSTPPDEPAPSMTRRVDRDPGPPFTIMVSRMRAGEDGYRLTGMVRNDGSETYEGIGIVGTFFGAGGLWYGPVDAHCPCLFLEPGAQCPFSLTALPGDYVEFLLHPEGRPVEYRQPASLVLSDLHLSNDGIGNVRITGIAINENPFTVKHVTVVGALIDAGGQTVSLGSTLMPGDVVPGASVPFDVRIQHEPYSRYQLFVQAVRD